MALLSALVAVQTFTDKTKLLIDHRSAGLTIAIIALVFKAPFPLVVIAAAAAAACAALALEPSPVRATRRLIPRPR